MDEFNNETPIENIGNKKSFKKNKNIYIVCYLVLALVACAVFYDYKFGEGFIKGTFINSKIKSMDQSKEKNIINIQTDSKTSFLTFGKEFVQCSKDGVKYFNEFNEQKWSDTFTMTSPIIVCDENIFAVGEQMGRTVRVYNQSGFMYSVQTDNPISNLALNKNGYLSIIINNKTDYKTNVYTDKGDIITRRKDEITGVYPIAVDVSDDNRIMAISYLDTTDIEMISKVLYFYINENEGKEEIDGMFSAIEKKGVLVPVIGFMNENKLAAVSDEEIFLLDGTGKELWSVKSGNNIDGVYIGSKNNIAIAYGEAFSGKDGKNVGCVDFFDLQGKTIGTFEANANITYVKGGKSSVIIGAGRDYYSLGRNGKIIWQHKAIQDVTDILTMENNTVLYVTKNMAEILNMSKQEELKDSTGDVEVDLEEPNEELENGDLEATNDKENEIIE